MWLSLAEQMHTGGLESILHHGRKWSNQKQGKKHSYIYNESLQAVKKVRPQVSTGDMHIQENS